ncbi:MAG TPA: SRPBCC family protein [Dehalococcoidia bacterium]
MSTIKPSGERVIDAPPAVVYNCIADYNQHHANILAKEFHDLKVTGGSGVGAGTEIRFKATMSGRTRDMRAEVTEPQPGRVLVESYPDVASVTTFTVDPEGTGSRVRIDSELTPTKGIEGVFERLFAKRMLDGVYKRELANLDAYARRRAAQPQES